MGTAWGEIRYTWGSTFTKYTYTGQYSNVPEIGLMYYNARWVDPQLGRFVQADTYILNPWRSQSYDRFTYGLNNPLKYTDPTGHFSPEELEKLIGKDWKKGLSNSMRMALLAGKLGDIIIYSLGNFKVGAMFVLNSIGKLSLWDLGSKTSRGIAEIGAQTITGLYTQSGSDINNYVKVPNVVDGDEANPESFVLPFGWNEGKNERIERTPTYNFSMNEGTLFGLGVTAAAMLPVVSGVACGPTCWAIGGLGLVGAVWGSTSFDRYTYYVQNVLSLHNPLPPGAPEMPMRVPNGTPPPPERIFP